MKRDLLPAVTRIAVGVVLGLSVLVAAFVVSCIAMPGRSHEGVLPTLSAEEQVLVEELRADVDQLSVKIGERRAPHGDSLQRAARYLTERLAKSVVRSEQRVHLETIGQTQGRPENVVFDIPGKRAGPLVLVGAHYDGAQGTPAANDNGTGAAAALALARRLARAPHDLPIRIVLFANEEPPYFQTGAMGSLQHAAGCRRRGEQIRAMLSLETMGYYSEDAGSQKYPEPLSFFYPDKGDFIAFVGNLDSRMLVRDVVRRFRSLATFPSEGASLPGALPGVGWSDHWSFWQFDYPGVMVTDTAFFRDPNYHRASDVIENINFDNLARVVLGLHRVIAALATE